MQTDPIAETYVQAALASLHSLSSEMLDDYRRLGEQVGAGSMLGSSVTGDDFADACDAELAGRMAA